MNNESSSSDFEDDDDPDKIQIPGGGRDLATAARLIDKQPYAFVSKQIQNTEPSKAFESKIFLGQVTNDLGSRYNVMHQISKCEGILSNYKKENQVDQNIFESLVASSSDNFILLGETVYSF